MPTRVKSRVSLKVDNLPKIVKAIKALAQKEVLVGVPAEDTERSKPGITNAALAYIHDTGSPAANIPARPFMKPGIQQVKGQIEDKLKQVGQAALDNKPQSVEQGLEQIGLIAQNGIRAKITSGPFVPLAPGTLRSRRARGREGTRPLIDTGQLRNSITYVVADKEKR